ncbi:hypothetical protein DV515_00011529 [Chloebia gouldiae]|uniref:Uncharacterized protein n=1 Tax=Chloebia gouldiae TaxID=44316 RepID=A0A3L8S799_CHLGU|nr:hypothetical protein DV515_00011529 [Chloebia gouldiae]
MPGKGLELPAPHQAEGQGGDSCSATDGELEENYSAESLEKNQSEKAGEETLSLEVHQMVAYHQNGKAGIIQPLGADALIFHTGMAATTSPMSLESFPGKVGLVAPKPCRQSPIPSRSDKILR